MQQQTFTNMEQLKAKIKANPYVKATALLILAPVAAYDWLEKHKVGVLCSLATTALLVLFVFVCGSCGEDKDEYTPTFNGGELVINDISAAYSTGVLRPKTEFIVIHHTAGSDNGKISDIAKIHLKQNKWNSIGYHYFIDVDGTVTQLRDDRECAPHSYHYNNNSVAIVLNGNFSNHPVGSAQYTSLVLLVRELMAKYGLGKDAVKRHCDLNGNSTECPGKYFNLQQFKKDL